MTTTTTLFAVQINRLGQRLSEVPLGRSATTAIAAERFGRLLAARIGAERGALEAASILAGESFDQAEARLTLVLDYGNDDPDAGVAKEPAAPSAVEPGEDQISDEPAEFQPTGDEAKVARAPVIGKRQAIVDQAQAGSLPPAPDFSKPTHARFRAKLAQVVALAEAGDIAALQAIEINLVSSSPKAMARYRDLCVIALTARTEAAS